MLTVQIESFMASSGMSSESSEKYEVEETMEVGNFFLTYKSDEINGYIHKFFIKKPEISEQISLNFKSFEILKQPLSNFVDESTKIVKVLFLLHFNVLPSNSGFMRVPLAHYTRNLSWPPGLNWETVEPINQNPMFFYNPNWIVYDSENNRNYFPESCFAEKNSYNHLIVLRFPNGNKIVYNIFAILQKIENEGDFVEITTAQKIKNLNQLCAILNFYKNNPCGNFVPLPIFDVVFEQ